MRDQQIIAANSTNARRQALLFSQSEMLNTWQMAFEAVLKVCRLKDRIRWAIWPAKFVKAVQDVQLILLQEGQKKREEIAAKPKLTLVGANGHG